MFCSEYTYKRVFEMFFRLPERILRECVTQLPDYVTKKSHLLQALHQIIWQGLTLHILLLVDLEVKFFY